MGMQTRQFAATIVEDLGLPMTVDEFVQESQKILKELFPLCQVRPGEYINGKVEFIPKLEGGSRILKYHLFLTRAHIYFLLLLFLE